MAREGTSVGDGSQRGLGLDAFVPRLVLDWARRAPAAQHQAVDGSMVFVDISGFTALSERLATFGRIGAEEITALLDEVFAELLAIAYGDGGSLLKFGGDALLLFFSGSGHGARAVHAADGMRRALVELGELDSLAGKVRLGMTVGAHTGVYDFFLVGTSHRELIVTGPAASRTVELEGAAASGEVMLSPEIAATVEPELLAPGQLGGLLLAGAPSDPTGPAEPFARKDPAAAPVFLSTAVRRYLLAGGAGSEHRQAVVAFVAYDGTDALLEAEGPDACAAALHDLVTRTSRACDDHDVCLLGSDVAPGGGKLILVGGAPVGHDDDGERVIRVARAVAGASSPLRVRVGVNAGPLFAGVVGPEYRLTYTVMGDTVNLAARLAYQASAGEVLAAADLLASTRTRFATTAVPPFSVKGKSEPIDAVVVGAPREQQDGAALRLPLVGRDAELARLDAQLEQTAEAGRAVELVGPAGIGKSRLLAELRNRHPERRLRYGGCTPYESGTPYFPFRQLLRHVLDLGDDPSPDDVVARVGALVPDLLPWSTLVGTVVDVAVPLTPEVERLVPEYRARRLQQVVGELLERVLPPETILRIEDVHWIDDASRALVEHVIRAVLPTTSWLLVLTSRTPTFTDEVHEQLTLAPLSADAVDAVAVRAAADGLVTLDVARDLAARAEGNPLFLEQILSFAGRGDEVPDTVERLIAARIDQLSPRLRLLLRQAALLGASFDLDLLRAVTGEAVTEEDLDVLDAFLVRERSGRYRFEHDLYREVAYAAMPFRQRRALHEVAGRVIETRHLGRTDEAAELLALHYHRAGLRDRSWRYTNVAARRARERYALADAARFLRWGLDDVRRDDGVAEADIAACWAELGDALEVLGNYPAAADAYERARALAPPEARLELWHRSGIVREREGNLAQALRWYSRVERATEHAAAPDEQLIGLRARLRKAEVRLLQGRDREVRRDVAALVAEIGRHGDPELEARAHFVQAWALETGPVAEASRARALELYEQAGDLIGQANMHLDAGVVQHESSLDWGDVVHHYAEARRLKTAAGDEIGAAIAAANLGEVLADQGRHDEAVEALDRALEVFRASGFVFGVANTACYVGRARSRRGDDDAAAAAFDAAEAAALEARLDGVRTEVVARRAELALFRREFDLVDQHAHAVLDHLGADASAHPLGVSAGRITATAAALRGRDDQALHRLDRARAAADAAGCGYEALLVDAVRAWVLEVLDPHTAVRVRAGVEEVAASIDCVVDPLRLAVRSLTAPG